MGRKVEQAFGICGEEGCCWWRADESARVNQERGRKESAGQWKLPRRKATETVGWTWL